MYAVGVCGLVYAFVCEMGRGVCKVQDRCAVSVTKGGVVRVGTYLCVYLGLGTMLSKETGNKRGREGEMVWGDWVVV